MDNVSKVVKWEHEIKSPCANLESNLVILQRMINSPNRKNLYTKFDEWSAWKKNDVNQKIAKLKSKVDNLKQSAADKGENCKPK